MDWSLMKMFWIWCMMCVVFLSKLFFKVKGDYFYSDNSKWNSTISKFRTSLQLKKKGTQNRDRRQTQMIPDVVTDISLVSQSAVIPTHNATADFNWSSRVRDINCKSLLCGPLTAHYGYWDSSQSVSAWFVFPVWENNYKELMKTKKAE